MRHALPVSFVAMLVLGCADVSTGEDTNPFGDGTAATGMGTGQATGMTSNGDDTTGSGGSTGMPTTESPTTESPTTAEASSSGPSSATDDATSTSGGTGEVGLGECIGLGAWETCAQYCEAVLEVCVEAGCDGSTVVYYGDVAECNDMQAGNGEATPCNEAFAVGGGVSFGRCCCQ